jgi:hypothetical protein
MSKRTKWALGVILALLGIDLCIIAFKVSSSDRGEDARRADAGLPDTFRQPEIGTTTAVGAGPSWPCAPSKGDLKELMIWHKAMMDERTPDSVMNNLADTLMRTGSIMVGPRTPVRILDADGDSTKIAVLDDKATSGYGYQAVAARGCWVSSQTPFMR